ncbi:D-alanyl-D-alanine carboxypeptidase [Anaerocolumna aminovalerica]|uniref:D-alanyl-D-alanine carboxypeptidase family protein n=1 Tax=Anaerocolumna aminovalerica TaxID=1527 RepID=UPI00292CD4DA|nr:D-alanyl-D-alanine carboxypeptidase [Anaerocolumna aminovalerica]
MDEEIKKQLIRKRKMQRRKRMIKLYGLFFIATTLLLFLLVLVIKDFRSMNNEERPFKISDIRTKDLVLPDKGSGKPIPDIPVDLDHLNSPNVILVDLNSEKVLVEQDSSERIYPASLTKIMTAILAIENTPDLEKTLIFSSDLFQDLYSQNASLAGFQPGEKVKYKDALYGILLPSGAECCLAFADSIAGSETAFVEMMNKKAAELGMKNTHFRNTTGLHDDDHYSTVEDIYILLRYALKNEVFRTVFTSSRYSTTPSNSHPGGFTFHSTMFKYMDSAEVTGGEILGGKTGYTGQAGLCLASLASVNGHEYILVTANADGTHQTKQLHILDAVNIYNQIGVAVSN